MSHAQPGYGYVLRGPEGTLAIGSRPPLRAPLKFDVLVLTAEEVIDLPGYRSATSFPGIQALVVVPLDDATLPGSEVQKALSAGYQVAAYVRRGARVLVTCNQGRNRSGLVTALALMDLGYSEREAVRRVRAARGDDALSNPFFMHVLDHLEASRRTNAQRAIHP